MDSDGDTEHVSAEEYEMLSRLVEEAEAEASGRPSGPDTSALDEDGPARRTRAATKRQSKTSTEPVQRTSPKKRSRMKTETPSTPTKRVKKDLAAEDSPTHEEKIEPHATPKKERTSSLTHLPSPHPTPKAPSPSKTNDQRRLSAPTDTSPIVINRAPVLCLWAATVAQHEGYDWKTALSIGKTIMVNFAQSKARSIGITEHHEAKSTARKSDTTINAFGLHLPAQDTKQGLRACCTAKNSVKQQPADPVDTEWYLRGKFGARYDDARRAMAVLASKYAKEEIGHAAYRLYEEFRPDVSMGRAGWGGQAEMNLETIMKLGP
ncbi:hypothetical protein DFJ77DRAFT_437552 [Powellomyces hirtus]|nr:hypothetical protein DFJ77DRAFT_437552 [Powellomyces hirtus]